MTLIVVALLRRHGCSACLEYSQTRERRFAVSRRSTRIPGGEAAAYGPVGRSPWLDVDWRAHQRWIDGRRAAGQHDRARPRDELRAGIREPAARLRPRAVRLLGRTGSSSCPCSPASTASSRSTCPASATRRCPATDGDHDLRLRAPARRPARRARDRRGGSRRQLDGRLHLRRARDRVPAARRAARADLRRRHLHDRQPAPPRVRCPRCAAWRRCSPAPAPGSPPNPTPSRDVRVCARRSCTSSRATPAACRRRSPPSSCAAPASPASCRRLQSILDYDIRERLPEIACPTLIVWGDGDRLITVRDADVFERADPRLAQGHLRGHRPHGDARAPRRVQRAARGLPRGVDPRAARTS